MGWFGKKKEVEPVFDRVRALNIQRGDIVVVTVPQRAGKEHMEATRDLFIKAFGNVAAKVIVLPFGMKIEHIQPAPGATATVAGVHVDDLKRPSNFEDMLSEDAARQSTAAEPPSDL